jgi:hypothetical protein
MTTYPFSSQFYDIQKALLPVAVMPDFRFGNFQGGIGINLSMGFPQLSPLSYRIHGGATYLWKNEDLMGNDMSGWETRYGAELGINGVSYGGTVFNSSWSGTQTIYMTRLGNPFFNAKYENDMSLGNIPGLPRGDGDRYRSAAAQINFGPFSIGTNIITGDAGLNRKQKAQFINGHWTYVIDGKDNPNSYRMGTLYFGFGSFRFGGNSEGIRSVFQNQFAHDFLTGGGSKWFEILNLKPRWYWGFGYNGGGTLW